MKAKLVLLAIAPVCASLMSQDALASGSMRCGTHIIAGGMRDGPENYEVLKNRGEPEARGVFTWTYRMPNGTVRLVHFDHSGRLSRIEQETSGR